MKKRKFNLMYFIIPAVCLLCVNVAVSQDFRDSLKTWEQQMEYLKNKPVSEDIPGDGKYLRLLGYTYKGVIDSETTKAAVIDSIFAPGAPFPLLLDPIVLVDTTYSGDTCTITEKRYPKFEVITVGRAVEVMDSLGMENIDERLREGLNRIVEIGWKYLDTEWEYKGKKYNSIVLFAEEHGGFVYESVSSQITTGHSITQYDSRYKQP